VQVIHVNGVEAIEQAKRAAESVHAVLLDSGNPNLKVKQLGGTGRRHDWTLSAQIRERLDIPVILAGGLTPDNAVEALATVRPYAIDVCSGLRGPDGALDRDKLARFAAVVTARGSQHHASSPLPTH
jgi:phosphoribosylanthranilate isomerase